ncbi:uncharacterized protein LOC142069160 [Caretta caretta]|uniref:uncharacterized protein LOC142069160 n=1 Tax=Caretta caretta TaxID=8467 RepID=UPI003F4C4689
MADRSEGAELTLTSGEEECEMRVCDTDGEPRGNVAEPMGDVYLARLCARPQALSMETLQGARDGLERSGELGKELGSCLDLALERFCREPPCVQGNARMTLSWAGGSLEFLSGDGGYTISVFYHKGNPYYYLHIKDLPGHLYVAWLRSRKERLSSNSLLALFTGLRFSQGDTAALRVCFHRAWEGFRREPRCVQDNARLLIRWGREELVFISGQGQCEISVLLADGEPQYHVTELGGNKPVTWSHASPEPLSVANLARVRDRLGRWGALGKELSSCFGEAIVQFRREPRCVQENARLLIRWGREKLEFVSGQGQCEISVLLADGEPQYHITELGRDRPVTWSHASPEPLSVADLVRVRDRLGRWGALGEELSSCFGEAISQFSQEPRCVQGNARMRIRSDGGTLELLSGEGQCEISVCCRDGRPQYKVGELSVHMYLARLFARPEPLSADGLQRVLRKLGSCQEDTGILRACISHALDQFVQEPWCVQENARLLIRWGGEELELVSGQGQCEISVLLADGEPQYRITELGGDRPVTWSHASPEPLSVADLARVRDRLGRWGRLGKELSVCFGEAISRFSREPPWVQGNARMGICWDRNRLEFLSGEGQCEISLRYRHGRAQYEVGELPGHINLARLHTLPEPEHEPPETPHD